MRRERDDPLAGFTPLLRDWFIENVGEPTPPQRAAWPAIRRGEHALVVSPTGSGKTLAAFYGCLDDIHRALVAGEAVEGVRTLYVSPARGSSRSRRIAPLPPPPSP